MTEKNEKQPPPISPSSQQQDAKDDVFQRVIKRAKEIYDSIWKDGK